MASEYNRVVATAQRILGDRGDAEDVAQEIFADCARSHRMHAPGIEAWLCVSAAHRALNLLRGRKRRIARELRAFRLHDPLHRAAEHVEDPLSIIERSDAVYIVRMALLALPRHSAEILALRYAGLAYKELADALGIDITQVGTRLARAERALKKEIEHATH